MAITAHTFGIEIECYRLTAQEAARALRNAGLDARAEMYNHTTRPYWKVVTDASVQDNRGRNSHSGAKACEVVSPVIRDTAVIATVCKALANAGAKVNKTCGLHPDLMDTVRERMR